MRVLILYDEPAPDAPADGLDVLDQVEVVEVGLRALGHRTERLGLSADAAVASAAIAAASTDITFNLVESFAGRGRLIHLAPTLLEALGRAYVGAPAEAVFATSNKLVSKCVMAAANLPTPAWIDPANLAGDDDFQPGTYIVKSVWEHASIGLDEDSVIEATTRAEVLGAIADRLPALGYSGFAERYVDGREFNLSVIADGELGARVLPPAEIVFEGYGPDKRRVVGYRAKWDPESYEYSHTPRRFDLPRSDDALVSELERLALAAWRRFDLAGWARVDFRVDPSGRPWILEVNTNPCLSLDAGFAAALDRAGITRTEALERILADVNRPPGRSEGDR